MPDRTLALTHVLKLKFGDALKILALDTWNQILELFPHHVHDLGPLDGDEVDACLVGDGLSQQRLAASRRAAQEHTGRRIHACIETSQLPRFLYCVAMNLGVPLAGLALLQLATAQGG